jgi:hypothetical protein
VNNLQHRFNLLLIFSNGTLKQNSITIFLLYESPNDDLAKLVQAMHDFLGKNVVLAYLVMMGIRLLELRKVLKPTGSIRKLEEGEPDTE